MAGNRRQGYRYRRLRKVCLSDWAVLRSSMLYYLKETIDRYEGESQYSMLESESITAVVLFLCTCLRRELHVVALQRFKIFIPTDSQLAHCCSFLRTYLFV